MQNSEVSIGQVSPSLRPFPGGPLGVHRGGRSAQGQNIFLAPNRWKLTLGLEPGLGARPLGGSPARPRRHGLGLHAEGYEGNEAPHVKRPCATPIPHAQSTRALQTTFACLERKELRSINE